MILYLDAWCGFGCCLWILLFAFESSRSKNQTRVASSSLTDTISTNIYLLPISDGTTASSIPTRWRKGWWTTRVMVSINFQVFLFLEPESILASTSSSSSLIVSVSYYVFDLWTCRLWFLCCCGFFSSCCPFWFQPGPPPPLWDIFLITYYSLSLSLSGSSFAIQLFVRWEKMQRDKDHDQVQKKIRCFSSRVARPFIQFKVSSGDSSFLWYDLWHPRCLCLFYVKLIILGLRYYAIFPMPLPARWGISRHLGFYPSKMVPLTHTLRRFLVIRERKKKKIQHGPKVKGKLGDVNDPVWFPWILLQGDMGELMIRGRLCGPKD